MEQRPELGPDTVAADPLEQLRRWFDEAVAAGVRQPDAMTLATATRAGVVSARTVLMRGLDERGVAFYTNLESDKAHDLAENPGAALVFHWREVERQVRVTGAVTRLTHTDEERYWASRPFGHRLSAWASPQSRVVTAEELAGEVLDVTARYAGVDPPLPPFWGGYVVAIDDLECWQGRSDRLHDRVRYRRVDHGWVRERIAP